MSNGVAVSRSHIVLIPSYNNGKALLATVRETLKNWSPVWVVIDGSTDASERELNRLEFPPEQLRVLRLEQNQGKGAAVLYGMRRALGNGYEFALVMDADGQHPAECIRNMMDASQTNPDAMVLGKPLFGPDAPAARRYGRLVGNWWADLETLWGGIGDSLFGFRVYPIAKSVAVLGDTRGGRRFDFETQLAVRLFWSGVRPLNLSIPVRYFTREQGGVSHFHYLRDNLLLLWVHMQLVLQTPYRMTRRRFLVNHESSIQNS